MNDTQSYIGKLLDENHPRDAIHIAVAPVIAGELMFPGQHVGLDSCGRAIRCANPLGVVDPFLRTQVDVGERFFIFLYPNTVTGMVHHWSHPAFETKAVAKPSPPTPEKSESEEWLRAFAERFNFVYDEMIESGVDGTYICAHNVDLHGAGELGGEEPLFWEHLEVVTGKIFSQKHRNNTVWTCSC